MSGLSEWLEKLGLGHYTAVMAENDVDLDVLPHLSEEDLKELGLSLGHRRRLLAALRTAEPETSLRTPAADGRTTGATAREAERRQLTVMFCDLVGSTELSQRLDPEELRDVLRCYQDAVTGAVAEHDGHVAKLLGDGVLAYFGWPAAHEDDAARAILSALAAVASVRRLTAGGEALAARAGVATGPVVIGDMRGKTAEESGSVAGETPNLAARLQGAAAPGEVVIHATTRQLVGGIFTLDALEPQPLKGFAEPMPLWRVAGMADTADRFEALHGGSLTQFVGRSHDIALLQDRWRLATEGEGQVVLLCGEAGIGKSRVLREFSLRLDADERRSLRYQCSPQEANAAFQPVIAEIEATAGLRPEDPTDLRFDRLERHLRQVMPRELSEEATALFAGLLGLPAEHHPAVEMAPQRRKQRTVALLAERLAGLARAGPLLLLVEDLHWVDPSTLEFLDAVVARVRALSVLAVMTCRPEFSPPWVGHGHVTVHSLNRLGRSDSRAVAERVAGGKALPAEVLSRIVARTDGIPLFVEELTKTVLEAGVLEEQADRYVAKGSLPAIAIPSTLQDSLMARLDRLAPVKRVVQAAACIGREFDVDLLAQAMPMSRDELDAALARLLDAELIFGQGDAGEEARYIFKHALVQDAAYTSLLIATRRELHERLALALERSADTDPLELARHFHAAGAEERAAGLYLEAGRRALAASALPEAIGALELGLEATGSLPPSTERDRLELDLRVALGTARMANFGWAHPSVAEAMEPAVPLAKAFAEEDALASILWALWVHYQTCVDFPRAHQWLDELQAAAAERPQSDLPLIHDMSAGCQCFWEANYPRALAHTDRLKSVYDPARHARITALTNHDPLVFSQHWAGTFAEWIRGCPDRALERLEEAIPLARRIGHPFNLMFALTAGSSSLIYLDQAERMLAFCDEAERVVEEEALGPFALNVCVHQWRGAARILRGAFLEGHALVSEGNAFWTASGGGVCTAMMRSWIVLGLMGLGRIDEAAALNAANIAHCRNTGDRYMEPECVRLQGDIALADGRSGSEIAEGSFREAAAIARAHGAKSWELRAATSLARLLQGQDRRAEAVAILEPSLEQFVEGRGTADLVEAEALLVSLS